VVQGVLEERMYLEEKPRVLWYKVGRREGKKTRVYGIY
jgi:hypothetical protein